MDDPRQWERKPSGLIVRKVPREIGFKPPRETTLRTPREVPPPRTK